MKHLSIIATLTMAFALTACDVKPAKEHGIYRLDRISITVDDNVKGRRLSHKVYPSQENGCYVSVKGMVYLDRNLKGERGKITFKADKIRECNGESFPEKYADLESYYGFVDYHLGYKFKGSGNVWLGNVRGLPFATKTASNLKIKKKGKKLTIMHWKMEGGKTIIHRFYFTFVRKTKSSSN